MTVTAPTAILTDVTTERHTPDSHADLEYELQDADILLSKLTANQGTLVISKTSLNSIERQAVVNGWPQQGGFKTPGIFFSIEEHPSGFSYGDKTIKFEERDGKTYVRFTSNAAAQEAVFAVSYDSHTELNNAALTNVYEPKPVTLEIIKADAADMENTYLAGAKFKLKKLDPESKGTYLTGNDAVEKESGMTGTNGKAQITDITDGYYEISETEIPPGYVLVDDGKFYIKVHNGMIKQIIKTEDNLETTDVDEGKVRNWTEQTNTTNVWYISRQAAVPDNPETTDIDESVQATITFRIGNEAGAALPHTGGPGTEAYLALGAMMAVGAGAVLIRRKLKRQ